MWSPEIVERFKNLPRFPKWNVVGGRAIFIADVPVGEKVTIIFNQTTVKDEALEGYVTEVKKTPQNGNEAVRVKTENGIQHSFGAGTAAIVHVEVATSTKKVEPREWWEIY